MISTPHVILVSATAFVLGMFAGAGLAVQKELAALNDCHAKLPRNEFCKVVITAVPVKEGL